MRHLAPPTLTAAEQKAILSWPLITEKRDPVTERTLRPIVAGRCGKIRWPVGGLSVPAAGPDRVRASLSLLPLGLLALVGPPPSILLALELLRFVGLPELPLLLLLVDGSGPRISSLSRHSLVCHSDLHDESNGMRTLCPILLLRP
jgi:hypothetical protein